MRARVARKYGARLTLNPREVAELIEGNSDALTVKSIHRRLANGSLVPNLRRSGGRWLVPVDALLDAVDALTQAPPAVRLSISPAGPPGPERRRGRKPMSPALGVRRIRIQEWATQVMEALVELRERETTEQLQRMGAVAAPASAAAVSPRKPRRRA